MAPRASGTGSFSSLDLEQKQELRQKLLKLEVHTRSHRDSKSPQVGRGPRVGVQPVRRPEQVHPLGTFPAFSFSPERAVLRSRRGLDEPDKDREADWLPTRSFWWEI